MISNDTESVQISTYKNKKAVVLENNRVRAVFTPDPGGKMVSLTDKATGYEYLVQRPGAIYLDQPFDGVYTEGECSGFDDMFPTIDEGLYHLDPWKGVKMADHGEVWSLPWHYQSLGNKLEFEVKGKRFPYRLQKTVEFAGETSLRWNYTLFNESENDFNFLWAGHFMFNMEPGTRLLLPPDCLRAVSVLSNAGRPFGSVSDWPYFTDKSGQPYRADISRPETVEGFEKFYFQNPLKEGWCTLEYPDGKQLTISFSAVTVPYLGILMNEKGWNDLYNIFLEPCTVCYDRPDLAEDYGQISTVPAKGTYHWNLKIDLNKVKL